MRGTSRVHLLADYYVVLRTADVVILMQTGATTSGRVSNATLVVFSGLFEDLSFIQSSTTATSIGVAVNISDN
jgi:hypothetical protein